jgi:alginate O-acetyltransferase complex protein AlgI
MLFNSSQFIFLFLPVIFVIYFILNRFELILAGKAWLVISSLYFYSYWNNSYLLILLFSLFGNYTFGNLLSRPKDSFKNNFNRKIILFVGILFNLLVLGYYKYYNFILYNVNQLVDTGIHVTNIILPLAISFFTFQQIAYLVDSYKQDCKEYDFLTYCLFVTFFPQLIAGPIVHHKEMMPQFEKLSAKKVNIKNIGLGLGLFSIGLFKKVLIADQFAIWANQGFNNIEAIHIFDAWQSSLSYTFQLYYDFSGYADMAIGLGLLFNITLPINFDSPYKATNIQIFWRCWHMTLSRWLKDYVYIPLGGSRCSSLLNLRNLFLTAFISGMWHGAGWTFLAWGSLHGLAMIIHRVWSNLGFKLNKYISWFITFNFINMAWVIFRSDSIHDALKFLRIMFNFSDWSGFGTKYLDVIGMIFQKPMATSFAPSTIDYFSFPSILIVLICVMMMRNSNQIVTESELTWKQSILFGTILGISIAAVLASKSTVFLYFNF